MFIPMTIVASVIGMFQPAIRFVALRSLRLCGNNLGVLCELCGYPRGLQLCATICQILRDLRRIPNSAHRAFDGRLPPAEPAAM